MDRLEEEVKALEGYRPDKGNQMGHSTATVIVRSTDVEPPVKSGSSYSSWAPVNNSLEERILRAGLGIWHRDEADRHDSARAGNARMKAPMTEEIADRMIDDMVSSSQRSFGDPDSPVIPLIDKRDYEKKEKKVTITLDGEAWTKYVKGERYDIIDKKIREAMPEQADMVLGFKQEGSTVFSNDIAEGWTIKSTIAAEASGGKAKTVYLLTADGKTLKKEYASQAEARADAIRIMKEFPRVLEINVDAKVVREDDTSLVKVRREVKSATAKFTVTFIKMKTATPRTDGWMVGFDYHH